jgi:hypothetical protein
MRSWMIIYPGGRLYDVADGIVIYIGGFDEYS